MNLQERKNLLVRLGAYMKTNEAGWEAVKQKAYSANQWFIPEFTNLAAHNVADEFLSPAQLDLMISRYQPADPQPSPKKVGIVMAGNIPLVGFHDFLCVFLTGHIPVIKLSSKDEVLLKHLIEKLMEWNEEVKNLIVISDMIRNCDAYIATGSNNSSRYFEYYFSRYPHIIRKNRTSVAILNGNESKEDLEKLADDVYLFFGLGCRNVTKVFVPEGYDFVPLLQAFRKYNYLADHNKYRNNYDYNLALHILNKHYYMTNESIILVEDTNPFSRISQLHYEYYTDERVVLDQLKDNETIQCTVNTGNIHFGQAQTPSICDFADGIDTMEFLKNL
jgi:hypothetical protein